ncbi:unnamed protein product [Oikopleura dioica]|uniref:Uncharacterized protein n=1 Tax=Oikopleura dioica TaxID=34765 RepID=E4XX43_OIKDI|nr:unnamed protein product [Oikopleura dioica]
MKLARALQLASSKNGSKARSLHQSSLILKCKEILNSTA